MSQNIDLVCSSSIIWSQMILYAVYLVWHCFRIALWGPNKSAKTKCIHSRMTPPTSSTSSPLNFIFTSRCQSFILMQVTTLDIMRSDLAIAIFSEPFYQGIRRSSIFNRNQVIFYWNVRDFISCALSYFIFLGNYILGSSIQAKFI